MSKFQIGDKVRITASCSFASMIGDIGTIVDHIVGSNYPYKVIIGDNLTKWNCMENDLELVEEQPTVTTFVGHPDGELEVAVDVAIPGTSGSTPIRTFDTGATRDTVQGKLDYVKGLSPIVLRRYMQYLDKHRLQSNGNMRDFDNWKKGIPQETYHSSGGRHFMAAWLIEEGYAVSDNHGPIDEENALCGLLFNTMGRLHEILKVKLVVDQTTPTEGGC